MASRWYTLGGLVVVQLAMVFLLTADSKIVPQKSTEAVTEEERRRTLIQAEISELTKHPWAGEYYKGDGLGENCYLAISPTQGYVFEWSGCLGMYDRNYGSVSVQGNELHLQYTLSGQRRRGLGLAPILVPVSWENRHYLVPNDEIVELCNAVNIGSEREWESGRFFLRRGDPIAPPTGFPNVPAEFKPYLLQKPIEAKILSVGKYTTEPSIVEWKFKITPVTIDAGSASGLRVGMELRVLEPPAPGTYQTVEITTVEHARAEGVVRQAGEDEPDPVVGSRISTRDPLYDKLRKGQKTKRRTTKAP